MRNLVEVSDEIKAVAQSCTGTPTAKLIALLNAAGITSTAEIAAILGVAIRTVQHAKRTSQNATHCANTQPIAAQPIAFDATHCVSAQPIAPRARVEEKLLPPKLDETPVSKNPLYPPNVIAMPGYATHDERCQWVNGGIVLAGDLQAFWLGEFDGDQRGLDLALKQAAGWVQPQNRCKPLEAQVSSQLARIVADRRDRDRRYAAAASQKAATARNNGKPTVADIIAKRQAAEAMGATA